MKERTRRGEGEKAEKRISHFRFDQQFNSITTKQEQQIKISRINNNCAIVESTSRADNIHLVWRLKEEMQSIE
jgi:hypothetical protein